MSELGSDRRSDNQRLHDEDSASLGRLLDRVFQGALSLPPVRGSSVENARLVASWETLLRELDARRQALFLQAEDSFERQAGHQRRLLHFIQGKSEELRKALRSSNRKAEEVQSKQERLQITNEKAINTQDQEVLSSEIARDKLHQLRAFLDQESQSLAQEGSEAQGLQAWHREMLGALKSLALELRTDMERRNYPLLLSLAKGRAVAEALGDKDQMEFIARVQHMVLLRERFRDIAHKLRLVELASTEVRTSITCLVTSNAGASDIPVEMPEDP